MDIFLLLTFNIAKIFTVFPFSYDLKFVPSWLIWNSIMLILLIFAHSCIIFDIVWKFLLLYLNPPKSLKSIMIQCFNLYSFSMSSVFMIIAIVQSYIKFRIVHRFLVQYKIYFGKFVWKYRRVSFFICGLALFQIYGLCTDPFNRERAAYEVPIKLFGFKLVVYSYLLLFAEMMRFIAVDLDSFSKLSFEKRLKLIHKTRKSIQILFDLVRLPSGGMTIAYYFYLISCITSIKITNKDAIGISGLLVTLFFIPDIPKSAVKQLIFLNKKLTISFFIDRLSLINTRNGIFKILKQSNGITSSETIKKSTWNSS